MKGLHTSLVVVIAAIVILIVALVVLTIFGVGIAPVSSLSNANAQCRNLCQATCRVTGSMPPTWDQATVLDNNVMKSCETLLVVSKTGGCGQGGC